MSNVLKKTEEPARSLEFMRMPYEWPHLVLPVVRRVRGEAGLMLEGEGNAAAPRVYVTNLFAADFENCKVLEYRDLEGVVDDGWVVD